MKRNVVLGIILYVILTSSSMQFSFAQKAFLVQENISVEIIEEVIVK